MCNLMDHTARDARQQTARQQEPIYANLADERGVEYQGPEQGPFSCPNQGEE